MILLMKSLLLGLVLTVSLLLAGCPGGGSSSTPPTREDLIKYSRETVAGLRDVVPILRANNLNTATLAKGINIGDRLVTAFENDQHADALVLTADLITAFEESQAEIELIKDGRVKTVVLVGLAVAKVALRRLSDLVDDTVVEVEKNHASIRGVSNFQSESEKSKVEQAKDKIKQFKKKKQWRCKNALTGRFEKMEFCRLNPATSYVVTFAR